MHLIIQLTTTHIHLPVHYEFYIRFVQFKTATHFFRNSIYEFGISQLGTSSRSYSLLLICISTLKSLALILVFWKKNTRLTKKHNRHTSPQIATARAGVYAFKTANECMNPPRSNGFVIEFVEISSWKNVSVIAFNQTERESYGGAREWLAKIIGREWDWVSTRVFWENETA